MGEDGDDIVSLPAPPPPRPAARREAIEAALARFDGAEPGPAHARRKPLRIRWAEMHRRPAGALVAATLIAIIAIPATQIALRDEPPANVAETPEPGTARPGADALPRVVANEALDAVPAQAAAAGKAATPAQSPATPPVADDERLGFSAPAREERMRVPAPEPERVAPARPAHVAAPPPPPPPAARRPAEPQAEAEAKAIPQAYDSSGADSIVVTGSRVDRPNLESAVPVTVIDPRGDFLPSLQAALAANDRRAVLRLTGFPLRVSFGGDTRTYRSARDVERDYDRIFTPAVRTSLQGLAPADLHTRDGGRLKGSGRIWFGCPSRRCSSAEAVRIREITP